MAEAKFTIRASDKTKAAFKSVRANMKSMSSKVLSLKTAVVGLAGAGGLGALAVASANSADALAKNADKLGVATEALGGLHLATKLYTSAGANAMNEALTKSIKRLGEFNATGGGAAAVWLKELNLDTQELATLAPDQLFARYAESIRGLNDRGQQMAAMSALMGDESRQLIGIIDAGSDAIDSSTQKAIAYGTALSRVDAAQIEAANDSFTEVQEAIKGVGTTIAVELSPYIQVAGQYFTDAANESGGWRDEIMSGVESIITGLGYIGDALRGLQVVWKGLEVVFAVGAEHMWQSWFKVADGIREIANLIPGINIESFSTLNSIASESSRRVAELKSEFTALVEQPMPSENVAAYLEEVKTLSREAATEVAKVAGGKSGGEDAGGVNDKATSEMQKQQEMLSQKLEQVNQFLMSEAEIENQAYENRLLIVEENFQNQLIGETQRKEILQNLELKHQNRLSEIEAKSLTAREKFRRKTALMQTKQVFGELAAITAGVAQNNKTMFKINQVAGIANAIINTYTGVTNALAAYPPPLSFAMAAAQLAAGFAQVNAIKSQSFGAGGSAPSLAGTGGGAGTVNTVPAGNTFNSDALGSGSASEKKTETRTLVLKDDNPERIFTTKQVRQVVEEIEEARQEMGSNTTVVFA